MKRNVSIPLLATEIMRADILTDMEAEDYVETGK
jgi:hypothetical protein